MLIKGLVASTACLSEYFLAIDGVVRKIMGTGIASTISYDAFLSHSSKDHDFVKGIANKLKTKYSFNIWLDRWFLIPGNLWQRELEINLMSSKTCVVFWGLSTPQEWFEQEIELALSRQAKDKSFRVIPVIQPSANQSIMDEFLKLRTWVDFSGGFNEEGLCLLAAGIAGVPPIEYCKEFFSEKEIYSDFESDLKLLKDLEDRGLIEKEVKIEFQRTILRKALNTLGGTND